MNEQYEFFWSGPFSQWYPSTFIDNDMQFYTAEQFMMYQKAMMFNDLEIAKQIMKTKDPRQQKALGRKVKNFIASEWNKQCRQIVTIGNLRKFSQNEKLKQILFATAPKVLVEASPYDLIWGIGLNAAQAANTPKEFWPGKNWLGLALTHVRDTLLVGQEIE